MRNGEIGEFKKNIIVLVDIEEKSPEEILKLKEKLNPGSYIICFGKEFPEQLKKISDHIQF